MKNNEKQKVNLEDFHYFSLKISRRDSFEYDFDVLCISEILRAVVVDGNRLMIRLLSSCEESILLPIDLS